MNLHESEPRPGWLGWAGLPSVRWTARVFANPTDTVKLNNRGLVVVTFLQISKLMGILYIAIKDLPPTETNKLTRIMLCALNECVGTWLPESQSGVANQIRVRGDIYWSLMLETAFYSARIVVPVWRAGVGHWTQVNLSSGDRGSHGPAHNIKW